MTPPPSAPSPTLDAAPADLPRATLGGDTQSLRERVTLGLFIAVPFVALVAAVPVAWGGWLSWLDVTIALTMYVATILGITVGYHRLFTHKSFKPNRAVKITLAVLGSMAVQGPLVRWVADHRKHHQFSDKDGDPHSPWRYGTSTWALTRGLLHAHLLWLFDEEQTPQGKYAPDLLRDRDLVRISRQFPLWVLVSVTLPAIVGGAVTGTWQGAATAFFWGTLVRLAVAHHVTWSINSICHAVGERPFASRDQSGNVWWLAIPSLGEAWHNLHHADPTCARHGVGRGQVDISARTIWLLEKAGWVKDVRWPTPERLDAKRAPAAPRG